MTEPHYSLDDIRENVTRIDNEILKLLAERRQLSLAVAKSKIQTAKPVRDQEREHALLLRLIERGKEEQLDAQYVTQIFHTIIEDSVLYQQAYLQKLTNPDSLQPTHVSPSWAPKAPTPISPAAITSAKSKPNW